jgi:PKD repeat protein
MKKIFYQLSTLLITFIVAGIGSVNAQTYTCQGHSPGCSGSNGAAAIKQIEIFLDGNSVYRKTPDVCNGGAANYNVMSTSSSFSLYSGNTYTIKFMLNQYYGNRKNFMAFLDLNSDGDYTDAGEHISPKWGTNSGVQTVQGYTGNVTYTETFYVPCNITPGTTRMRFRSNLDQGFGFDNTAGASSSRGSYGETEEYTMTLVNPTSIVSSFTVPTSLYAGTDVTLVSTGTGSSSWDLDDDGTIDGTGDEFTNKYAAGTYTMKNIATSACLGKDSSYKTFTIINPPQLPTADFVANKTDVQLYDEVKLFDLSQYGPTDWNWHLYDSSQSPAIDLTEIDRSGGTKKNPTFDFYETANLTVCLRGYNLFGWSAWKCKPDYILVRPFSEYTVASGQPTVTSRKGTMYDKGGRFADYERNAGKFTNFLRVVPCNAKEIDITFSQFKMADASDKIFIFDGPEITGTPLHPAGGFTAAQYNGKAPFTVTAKSGAFFIYYESNGSGQDSGFVATWDAEEGDGKAPVAGFVESSNPLYNSVEAEFTSTSANVKGLTSYEWLIDGTTYLTENTKHTFYTDGTYPVRLVVKTCLGVDTLTKTVSVVTPQDKAIIDFKASNQRPVLGELITIDLTNDNANTFSWEIFPANVAYKNGTSASSAEPQFNLTKPGCYTVTLTAYNSVNSGPTKKTIVKDYYICVVGYCTPSADITTQDISISNVQLLDGSTALINNSSAATQGGYTDYSEDIAADVLFGKEYSITMSRATSVDRWNGKVWIDWNIDGDFDDLGEEILSEGSDSLGTFTATFRVPSFTKAFEGKSRMRVACGYKGKVPTPCANMKIGEYEDYTINITRDNDLPSIILTGPSLYVMQVNTSGIEKYLEPGYTATDPSEGDITANVDVDKTELEEDFTGYYTIRYNVCDQSGNCAVEQTRRVKVVKDITAPTITLDSAVLYVPVSEKRACLGTLNTYTFDYSTIGATANDPEDGNLTHLLNYDANSVDMSVIGTYSVVYTVRDIQANSDTVTATVHVQDLVAPDIVLDGPIQLPLGLTWADQTWACDKYDENPVLVVIPGVNGMPNISIRGDYPVTYKAYDASGNNTIAVVRNYRVDDFTAPIINLHTNDTVYHDVNTRYYSVNPSAKDNITKTVNVTKAGVVDWHTVGVYQEVYSAQDESKNMASKTRFVHVLDREAPQVTGSSLCVKMGTDFWNRSGLIILDNYDNPIDLLEKIEIVASNVNVHVPGVYSIAYKVEDASGNQSAVYNRVITVSATCKEVSVKDISLEDNITVYPIPSGGKLNIDVNLTGSKVNAVVINLLGEVVADLGELSSGTNTVNLNVESSGVYFIRFTDGVKTA